MSTRTYLDGHLAEEWDDVSATYRRFAAGVLVESRPYTAAEGARAGPVSSGCAALRPVRSYPESPSIGDAVISAGPADLQFTADRRVVLAPTLSWESGVVQEPAPWRDHRGLHMLYTGGWASAAIGYAEATRAQGPWRKHTGPVIGNGAGGMSGPTAHHSVYVEDDTIYCYYPSHIDGGHLKVATAGAADPTTFTTRGTALTMTATVTGIANSDLHRRGPGDYVLMFDSRAPTGPMWQTGYATGPSPLGPFTVQAFPLRTLSRGDATSIHGSPTLRRQGSTWVLYYHASPTGVLPTDIWRATSTDLVTWTPEVSALVRRTIPQEYDQVADLALVDSGPGPTFAFWDGMNNVTPAGVILLGVPRAVTVQYDGAQWVRIL